MDLPDDFHFVECIETPQRDWWVVVDGRVVALFLNEDDSGDHFSAALKKANELSGKYGYGTLSLGTTWRSRAFDHLEDLSCRRSTCCRFIPRYGPVDWEEGTVPFGYEGGVDPEGDE